MLAPLEDTGPHADGGASAQEWTAARPSAAMRPGENMTLHIPAHSPPLSHLFLSQVWSLVGQLRETHQINAVKVTRLGKERFRTCLSRWAFWAQRERLVRIAFEKLRRKKDATLARGVLRQWVDHLRLQLVVAQVKSRTKRRRRVAGLLRWRAVAKRGDAVEMMTSAAIHTRERNVTKAYLQHCRGHAARSRDRARAAAIAGRHFDRRCVVASQRGQAACLTTWKEKTMDARMLQARVENACRSIYMHRLLRGWARYQESLEHHVAQRLLLDDLRWKSISLVQVKALQRWRSTAETSSRAVSSMLVGVAAMETCELKGACQEWRWQAETCQWQTSVVKRVLQVMSSTHLSAGWRKWRLAAKHGIMSMQRVMWMLVSGRLAVVWRSWRGQARGQAAKAEIEQSTARRILARMRSTQLTAAWNTWETTATQIGHIKASMRRVLRRLVSFQLALGWTRWRDQTKSGRAQQVAAQRVIRSMTHRESAAAFRKWYSTACNNLSQEVSVHRLCTRHAAPFFSTSLRVWVERTVRVQLSVCIEQCA